nr:adenylate/guanylate cyclase domain-containing protein [Nocardioides perillae]
MASRDGTVTLFFSDIEGSTALNDELGDKQWVKLVAWHDRLVRTRVVENDGHVVKTQGDGFMVAFADPVAAVRCAVQVQRDLQAAGRRPGRTPVRVRIGVHRGEAVHRDGDLFGRNVALAARVASLADGGELKVTDPVLAELDPDRVVLLGSEEVELKGLAGVHAVHTLDWSRRAAADA